MVRSGNSILCVAFLLLAAGHASAQDRELSVGIIGLDTSHVIGFTQLLNDPQAEPDLARCRVVAAYPQGSPDIESSVSRIPMYTEQIQKMGVRIVPSIDALLERVDCVLLETNDGRPHLEQALQVFRARKPVFIDKPVAGSLADAIAIYAAAAKYRTPMFSSSSHRFIQDAQAIRAGAIGQVIGCDTYGTCTLEPTHPDLFWYGIHGVEALFTVMGKGCESVTRISSPDTDVVVGQWPAGRIGSFRGMRTGKRGLGGTAYGLKEIRTFQRASNYRALMVEVVKFFRTGRPPVRADETLEIYAFMEAADESKRQGGRAVSLASVMQAAQRAAQTRLAEVEQAQ